MSEPTYATGIEIAGSTISVFEPTVLLRWNGDVLEQLWRNIYGPKDEWRPVPQREEE